jgi:hypothetical protein
MIKKRKQLKLCFFLIITFLTACSTDLKFDLPPVDPLLAVYSIVDPDNDFELIVTLAKPVQDEFIQMDRNCQANIYENDNHLARLKLDSTRISIYDDLRLNFYPNSDLLFSEGKEYKIEVNYPGFDPLIARTFKPTAVKIKEITFRQLTGEMPDWYYKTPSKLHSDNHSGKIERDTSLIEFTITFDDPVDRINFYRLGVKLIRKGYGRSPYNDIKLQYASYGYPDPCFMMGFYKPDYPLYFGWGSSIIYEMLFNDINSNGKEQSIKILVPGAIPSPIDSKYVIYLYSLSEDYYKYMSDSWKYFKTQNDIFAEPINFYSNSSNNCGIFAISSMDTDTVKFQ